KQFVANVFAEAAVGFKLRFGEELVGGGVVWETRIVQAEAADELALVPSERKLHVEQISIEGCSIARAVRVGDAAEAEMRAGHAAFVEPKIVQVDVDLHAEIDIDETLKRRQRMKCHLWILLAVDRDDELATAAQQLVHPEILDMSSVGQIEKT